MKFFLLLTIIALFVSWQRWLWRSVFCSDKITLQKPSLQNQLLKRKIFRFFLENKFRWEGRVLDEGLFFEVTNVYLQTFILKTESKTKFIYADYWYDEYLPEENTFSKVSNNDTRGQFVSINNDCTILLNSLSDKSVLVDTLIHENIHFLLFDKNLNIHHTKLFTELCLKSGLDYDHVARYYPGGPLHESKNWADSLSFREQKCLDGYNGEEVSEFRLAIENFYRNKFGNTN